MSMIPKIFHHTWPSGGPFKEKFRRYRESFMKHNPDYTFMFWTCEQRDQYAISDISRYLQSPECGLSYIVLSDILRFEILYKYGGIYVDTDVECLKNFDCFLENESFAAYSYAPNNIGNAVIGTVPDNPLCKDIVTVVINNLLRLGTEACMKKPHDTVGVNVAGRKLDGIRKIYPKEVFYPFSWADVEKNRNGSFPNSCAVHWWSGMDADGWTKTLPK